MRQSCHYRTQAEEYPFLAEDEILAACRRDEAAGARRFSIVTAGRSLKGEDLERALSAYRRLRRETGVELCASHGLQTQEEFERMKAAGVDRIHANLETSRRYFPHICTTHTYQDKVDNIRRAQAAGLDVCSGGILGMGETWEDRIDMALDLAALGIGSIPLNILRPIPGTPFGDLEPITNEEVLRAVAIFRYLNPTAWIRMAAGRGQFSGGGAELFRSGANAAITGDMLTTTGTSMAGDAAMFRALGFSDEDAMERFGHLINAFKFGAPPHGGLAYGLDRLVMLMAGADSIRDVIAFPKVQNASEPMTSCPDFVDDKQLDELNLNVTRREETSDEE